MIIKKIEIELEFPDDFTPPDKFIEPSPKNRFGWDEEYPLKKLFDKK